MSELRDRFGFALESAGIEPTSNQFRIRGWMNTFGVTHSRRLLHPRGFQNWLARTGGQATLPMLANHGVDVGGFATIGKWDRFEFHPGRGMLWSGFVAAGTPAADQARALLAQGILDQLSVGWVPVQSRYVTLKDADLDPLLKEAMEAAGVDEVRAFLDWYPIEGSIVDVADDPGARIAARLDALEERLAAALDGEWRSGRGAAALEARLVDVAAALEAWKQKPLEVDLSGLKTVFEQFLSAFRVDALEALEAIAADPRAEYAAALLAEDADAAGGGDGADGHEAAPRPNESAALLERLRQQPM